MLRSIKNLIGSPIHATDGDIGKVADCFFDDREWGLRYLVIDTGNWLEDRKVLISPRDLEEPEVGWLGRHVPVKLDKEAIRDSPPLREHEPVSQQYEEELARYYRHHLYWEGPFIWGPAAEPRTDLPHTPAEIAEHEARLEAIAKRHLRSADHIMGYRVHAAEGEIGHVADFIIDVSAWRLRHLVVDTRNVFPGKHVLLDIDWVTDIDWTDAEAVVNLTQEQVRNSPPYHPHDAVNREYEEELYDYYGKPRYWEEPMGPVM